MSKKESKGKKEVHLKDYTYAYALKNALEFGKADAGRILPKLFQHGLMKIQIKEIMPQIQEVVKEINSWDEKTRKMHYGKYKQLIPEKSENEERELPDLKNVKTKPIFRIAPFPSGALHIGNAKTFLLNALYAEKYAGKVILVIDDTIGSKEKTILKEAYELIEEDIKWLGIKKFGKTVYKSDRLDIYYKYAEELIKKDKVYICHCMQSEIKELREKGMECGCRQFPKDIQMKRWNEMFRSKEGHAVMRLKTDMKHPNPAFRDRVLFKISEREHPKVKNKYRVWPTLEMSWAIDDHLLGITHIIRGNELMIETEMERYIWDIFGWKHVEVEHVGHASLEFDKTGGKISKSKSRKEVESGKYFGWDDPRTWSIKSLARRGIKPEAIREFVKEVGLNRTNISVPVESLYAINRKLIDGESNRYFFVENPIEIKIESGPNWEEVEIQKHPDKFEKRKVAVSKKLLISSDDFNELKGKEVRLLHLFNVNLNEESKLTSIDDTRPKKIQWVSAKKDDFEKTKILMPNGLWIEGVSEKGIKSLKVGEIIQFERFGFCRYDGTSKGIKEFWFSHR